MSGRKARAQRQRHETRQQFDQRWLLAQDGMYFDTHPYVGVVVRPYHAGELALWETHTPERDALIPQVEAHADDWAVVLFIQPGGFRRGLARREEARDIYDDLLVALRKDITPGPVQGIYLLPDTEPGQLWYEDDPDRWQVFIGATIAWGVQPPGAACVGNFHEASDDDADLPLCEVVGYHAGGFGWLTSLDDDHESLHARTDRMWQANSDEQERGVFSEVYRVLVCPSCAEKMVFDLLQDEIVNSDTAQSVARLHSVLGAIARNVLGVDLHTVVVFVGKPGAKGAHGPVVVNQRGALDKAAIVADVRAQARSGAYFRHAS